MTIPATEGPAVKSAPHALADLREAAGLTQTQVGERMGVNKQRVGHIEASYPNINYGTLVRYIEALGGDIQFVVGATRASASELGIDPGKRGTHRYLKEREGRGGHLIWKKSGPAEELPLKSDAAQPGGDDTGGQVDQADTESDQGDSDQGQQV